MKFSYLIFSAYILQQCDTIILVKFGRVASHYRKIMKKEHGLDPLEKFKLGSRQMLCDAVIKAKQFMGVTNPAYYEKRVRDPGVSLTKWNLSLGNIDEQLRTLNLQRSCPSADDPKPSNLKYRHRYVREGTGSGKMIKSIHCAQTDNAKWFVTFGGVDKHMFLLEPGFNETLSKLRVTGIFEPSSIMNNKLLDFESFYDQFVESRERMTSVCKLTHDDRLRLCGAVFDVLSSDGSLGNDIEQTHYLRHDQRCKKKTIKERGKQLAMFVLPCKFVTEENPAWEAFYLLADSRRQGAVFAFLSQMSGVLKMQARVTNISALLNPVGEKERKIEDVENDEGEVEECEEGSKISKKRKRRKLYTDLDYLSTEDEEKIPKIVYPRVQDKRQKRKYSKQREKSSISLEKRAAGTRKRQKSGEGLKKEKESARSEEEGIEEKLKWPSEITKRRKFYGEKRTDFASINRFLRGESVEEP